MIAVANQIVWSPSAKVALAVVLALWFAVAIALGAAGLLRGELGELPLRLVAAVAVPIAVFLGLYVTIPVFRWFVLSADLRFVTMLQSWRVAGFAFLALYAHGVLRGLFAFPAGLGDIAVGLTAPLLAMALVQRPEIAASRFFVVWNLLGICDFVAAVGTGVLASGAFHGIVGGPTTAPMVALPLVIIPAFLVPLFTMLHLTALFQARALRRGAASENST